MNWLEELDAKSRAAKASVCGTGVGPGGTNICKTPGMRIRSGGRGRGLARGGGRGPIGIPYGGGRGRGRGLFGSFGLL